MKPPRGNSDSDSDFDSDSDSYSDRDSDSDSYSDTFALLNVDFETNKELEDSDEQKTNLSQIFFKHSGTFRKIRPGSEQNCWT